MRRVAFLLLLILFVPLTACASFPEDIHENPATYGHHRMEFDTYSLTGEKKELGISNIYLFEGEDFSNYYFTFKGIKKGTLYLKSNACGINATLSYDTSRRFYLSDLMSYPTKCSIKMTAEVSKINLRQHNIVETGVVKINVLPQEKKPLKIEYTRTNTISGSSVKTHSYLGQGSIQRQEGDLTSKEYFVVKTETSGGFFRISGCGNYVYTTPYTGTDIKVSLLDVYKKAYLNKEDSCDFEMIAIPTFEDKTYLGRFSINIYGAGAVKLEPLSYKIDSIFGIPRIKASGNYYVLGCSINDYVKINNNCSKRYYPNQTFWIRGFTFNGRKSLFGVRNNEVIWSE